MDGLADDLSLLRIDPVNPHVVLGDPKRVAVDRKS
jgi:hypothetical protein